MCDLILHALMGGLMGAVVGLGAVKLFFYFKNKNCKQESKYCETSPDEAVLISSKDKQIKFAEKVHDFGIYGKWSMYTLIAESEKEAVESYKLSHIKELKKAGYIDLGSPRRKSYSLYFVYNKFPIIEFPCNILIKLPQFILDKKIEVEKKFLAHRKKKISGLNYQQLLELGWEDARLQANKNIDFEQIVNKLQEYFDIETKLEKQVKIDNANGYVL